MRPLVNNAFYDQLGERWYEDDAHPIALLRAETRVKLAYVRDVLTRANVAPGAKILDGGCGAGLVTIPLAEAGYDVIGVDQSTSSLSVARQRARSPRATFQKADVENLSFADVSFDAVLLLDLLEHVDDPRKTIAEAARVLRPGGVLVFHTFNRTFMSWLLAVKALEVLMRGGPKHIHVHHKFIKPRELEQMATASGLRVTEFTGVKPKLATRAAVRSVFTRKVDPNFDFALTGSLQVGYLGTALRES